MEKENSQSSVFKGSSNDINLGFWAKLSKQTKEKGRPIFVLAPMADVTDCSFRHVIAKYGKPDVTWTEFVSADGLVRATPEGKAKLMKDLIYNIEGCVDGPDEQGTRVVSERPIVAQLFSSHPEYMKQACQLVAELGFDGVDINMGCPDKSIEKQGCGSAMIKNPKLAQEIILSAKEGAIRVPQAKFADDPELIARYSAGDKTALVHLPISVKTRIGYNKNELETWLPTLLDARPAVITIHARTRKEMSKVPARWEHIKRAVEIRDVFFENELGEAGNEQRKTLIFGNGDVETIEQGFEKYKETGCDGIMIGRGIFGNPWLFSDLESDDKKTGAPHSTMTYVPYVPSVEEKLRVMLEHTRLYEKYLGDTKSFSVMKKHYKAYVNGFDGAKELRAELMEKAEIYVDVERVVEGFLSKM
jgi:tRNA-dihydrouridine synthase B